MTCRHNDSCSICLIEARFIKQGFVRVADTCMFAKPDVARRLELRLKFRKVKKILPFQPIIEI